jgi:hypothetical protein
MTGVLKMGDSQPAASTLPEVEFALIISRTISALNDDPALLRSSVYELARITLWKDLFDGDPERGPRLAQALETAIRGVEDFSVRQKGGLGQGGSITGPMNELTETARLIAPQFPVTEIYPPSQSRAVALPIVQIDQPAFETGAISRSFARKTAATRHGSIWRTGLFSLGAMLFILLAGVVVDRTATLLMPGVLTGKDTIPKPPAEAKIVQPQADAAQMAAIPAPAAIPGLPLPTTYGNYAVNDGRLAELELLDGQVPDKRVAVSSPIRTASRTILPDGSPAFVIFRRDLATIPTDSIEARVVARIRHTMKVDNQTLQATYSPEELWSIRPFIYKFRSAPVPGNPEMMLIKPDGVALPPGRYVLVLKRQGYDFTVAGKITEPNQCLERTEAANGTFYSACSKIP